MPRRDASHAASVSGPTFIDGIGPPLEQIAEDAQHERDGTCGGWAEDVLALIAEVKKLSGENAMLRAVIEEPS